MLKEFFKLEAASGIVLFFAAVLAIVIANTLLSLFVVPLAFEETGVNLLFDERLGIIIGSLLSGVLGYLVLNWRVKKRISP
jgi:Na+/H+ antiporter NhaA